MATVGSWLRSRCVVTQLVFCRGTSTSSRVSTRSLSAAPLFLLLTGMPMSSSQSVPSCVRSLAELTTSSSYKCNIDCGLACDSFDYDPTLTYYVKTNTDGLLSFKVVASGHQVRHWSSCTNPSCSLCNFNWDDSLASWQSSGNTYGSAQYGYGVYDGTKFVGNGTATSDFTVYVGCGSSVALSVISDASSTFAGEFLLTNPACCIPSPPPPTAVTTSSSVFTTLLAGTSDTSVSFTPLSGGPAGLTNSGAAELSSGATNSKSALRLVPSSPFNTSMCGGSNGFTLNFQLWLSASSGWNTGVTTTTGMADGVTISFVAAASATSLISTNGDASGWGPPTYPSIAGIHLLVDTFDNGATPNGVGYRLVTTTAGGSTSTQSVRLNWVTTSNISYLTAYAVTAAAVPHQIDVYGGFLTWRINGAIVPGFSAVNVAPTLPSSFAIGFSASTGGTSQRAKLVNNITVTCPSSTSTPPSPPPPSPSPPPSPPLASLGGAGSSNGTFTYTLANGIGLYTFTASASFFVAPCSGCTYSVLVVAGGGGGGGGIAPMYACGGGGAGGVRTYSFTGPATYAITIGTGGAGGGAGGTGGAAITGGNGGNSVFGSITSTGGGGGACSSNDANSGGSGGGGAHNSGSSGGATVSPFQGYAGAGDGGFDGNSMTANGFAACGGGGARSTGTKGSGAFQIVSAGNGGTGYRWLFTGLYYGGGGGGSAAACASNIYAYGGTGGLGGGGNGAAYLPTGTTTCNSAADNPNGAGGAATYYGGGGGGAITFNTGTYRAGGSGYQGVVIVAYYVPCAAGTYRPSASTACVPCADGTYSASSQTSNGASSCAACSSPTVGSNYVATACNSTSDTILASPTNCTAPLVINGYAPGNVSTPGSPGICVTVCAVLWGL